MAELLSLDGIIFSIIATGIVDWRILPLAGLRRIIGRPDRALSDDPGVRRSCSRFLADRMEDQVIAGYGYARRLPPFSPQREHDTTKRAAP